MEPMKDEDFLQVYREVVQKTDDALKQADIQRKSTALSYSVALKNLDNKSTCLLLKENLKKLSNMVHKENSTIYDDKINDLLSKQDTKIVRVRQTGLGQIDVKSLISELPCSNSIICDKFEKASENSFQEFLTLFNEKRNKKPVVESRRTIAKCYAPQSCNPRKRFTKQHNTFLGISEQQDENQENENRNEFGFKTAGEELNVQRSKTAGNSSNSNAGGEVVGQKRKLGVRRGLRKFVSPMLSNNDNSEETSSKSQEWIDQISDDRLKNIEPRMVELIKSEIMDSGPPIEWNDIAGLEFAKTAIQEAVVWPMLRPDIFTGLRRPPKGILLFGPPGTGKTLIGKCVASQSKSTFFCISASSLTSKWIGDGEKMVRALFAVARCHQPAVIFIDEIDSLLSQRNESEHECSRRIKTEFLVQLDGATTEGEERVLVIGATNRPQELDEAARRRFVKRLYIPLPELEARYQLVSKLMSNERHELSEENIKEVAQLADGYSGADMRNLCSDASMGPIRCIDINLMQSIQTTEVRPVTMEDFRKALNRVRSSVSPNDLQQYAVWDSTYGSGSF